MQVIDKYNRTKTPPKIEIIERNIPKELKKIDTWVCWFWKWDNKKWTKPPCNPDGININHLQSSLTFKDCYKAYKNDPNIAGIGFSLRKDDKFCGIDFDDCLKKGKPNKRLKQALKHLERSYIERSPGGQGIRVFGVGKPKTRGSSGAREIEIYNSGRYLTITGKPLKGFSSNKLLDIEKACKTIDKKIYKESKVKNKIKSRDLTKHENASPRIQKLKKYEAVYDASLRDDWWRFGMIIHYETNGRQEGFNYWNNWSKGTIADNYDEGTCVSTWKSFKKTKKGKVLTIASAIKDYNEKFIIEGDGEEIEEEIYIKDFEKEFKVKGKEIEENENSVLLYKGITRENQLTIIVAPPNAGKSAIMFFRVSPDLAKVGKKVLYIDVDSAASDRALMYKFSEQHKFTFINPDAKKKKSTSDLIERLHSLSYSENDLKEYVFIIDTLKKLNDMMSKSDTKKTMDVFKRLVGKGATVIVMAHSNKFADKQGDWVYEGTNDMLSEPDALIYLYFEKNGETKDVVITSYPYKERAEIGQATFLIKGGERDLTNINDLVTKKKEVIDVKLDGKEYKGMTGKKHTVKDVRTKIDKVLLFQENDWMCRTDIESKLKGIVSREKITAFLAEYSEGKRSHYKFKKGSNNKYFYKVRNK